MELSLLEGNCDCLHVDHPTQDFLGTGQIYLPRQNILGAFQVLGLIAQVQEEPLEGLGGAIKDLLLSFGPALHLYDDITHIEVYMGEAFQGV